MQCTDDIFCNQPIGFITKEGAISRKYNIYCWSNLFFFKYMYERLDLCHSRQYPIETWRSRTDKYFCSFVNVYRK